MAYLPLHLLAAATPLPSGEMKAGFAGCEDECEREPLNNNVFVFVSRASLHSGEQSLLAYLVSSVSFARRDLVITP